MELSKPNNYRPLIDMQTAHAADYANLLLKSLGSTERVLGLSDHPALAWRRSGLFQTTQAMLPIPLASAADGALMALKAVTDSISLPINGSTILGERARLRQTIRQGRQCAGGYGYLIDTKDGRIALNLVREDDWDLVPAWLEDFADDWSGITAIAALRETKTLVDRAAEIGLAVAEDEIPAMPKSWFKIERLEAAKVSKAPLIVDLSGLWAGPLASSLLAMCGARVVKVEGPSRPDGMRAGHKGFYELLNGGKACAAFDFRDAGELNILRTLLDQADVVIEASRPRALRQLGIDARDFVNAKPGKIWARLTAYGQAENRIGFGDDIGVAAGLSSVMEQTHGQPCFVGDAIADPVNGLHLALAIAAILKQGGGAVIDLSMRDVIRFAMGEIPNNTKSINTLWTAIARADSQSLYPLRNPTGKTNALGADTDSVISAL